MFKYILNRLTERSTWTGIIGLATAGGAVIEAAIAEQIIAGVPLRFPAEDDQHECYYAAVLAIDLDSTHTISRYLTVV